MFFLARTVFGRPVAWLEENLGFDELLEWVVYYELEPWGETWDDAHAAQVSRMIYAANKGKRGRVPPLKRFMLQRGRRSQSFQTPEQLRKSMGLWVAVSEAVSKQGR